MLPDPNPSLLCHEHTRKAVFNRAVWEVLCVSSPQLISEPFLHFGSRFHGLPGFPGPLQTICKHHCPLPTISGQDALRLNLMKENLNWVAWPFTCCAPAPSPRNQVQATQPLRPPFPLSVPHRAPTEAADRSYLPGASLPGGTEK